MATYYWVGRGIGFSTATTDPGNWSYTSGGPGGYGPPTAADDGIVDSNSWASYPGSTLPTLTFGSGGTINNFSWTGTSGATVQYSNNAYIYGNFYMQSGVTQAGIQNLYFSGSGTQVITTNGNNITCGFVLNGTGTYQLGGALSLAGTLNLTSGTLDLNSYTLGCNAFSSSNSNTRAVLFNSGYVYITGSNATVFNMATATGYSYTGIPTYALTYSGSTGTRNIAFGQGSGATESNVPDIYVIAGSDTIATGGTEFFGTLYFSGFTGTYTRAANPLTLYRNLVLGSGMTYTTVANAITFAGTVASQQNITSNGVSVSSPLSFTGTTTYQLQDSFTTDSASTVTLTSGTLDLNGNTLTAGLFSSSNSNTRSILFGIGSITLTGSNATIWTTATNTNFSYTGTSAVNCTYSGSTGTRILSSSTTSTEANSLNFNITAGSDTVTIANANSLNFTGFTGTLTNSAKTLYGSLTLNSGMTLNAGTAACTFAATLQQQNITTAGNTIDFPLTFSGTNTYQLQDNLVMGLARTLILTSGTLNLNNKTISGLAVFSSSNSNVRSINFGTSGKIVLSVGGTAWTTNTSTNFTTSGTGTISIASSSATTFLGGGASFPNLSQDGSGTLTISGSNTFTKIANTVAPTTITLTASTTTTVGSLALSGTSGNLVILNSSTSGTKATLKDTSGTNNVLYTSIKDSAATGGAVWNAFTGNGNIYSYGNVNAGNNTGWNFTPFSGGFLGFF